MPTLKLEAVSYSSMLGSFSMVFALIFELTEKEESATGRGLSEKGLGVKEHNITNHTKQILILIMLVST